MRFEVGLREAEAGIDRSVDPVPDGAADRRQADDVRQLQRDLIPAICHHHLAGGNTAQRPVVHVARRHLHLEGSGALQLGHLSPVHAHRPQRIGADLEAAPVQALDLAGEPVAVLEGDDVDLVGRRDRAGERQEGAQHKPRRPIRYFGSPPAGRSSRRTKPHTAGRADPVGFPYYAHAIPSTAAPVDGT